MKERKYEVSVYKSECSTITFTIKAEDLADAQKKAAQDCYDRGYDVDDLIDVIEIDEEDSPAQYEETRKERVERETREFLCKVLVESYDIDPTKAEDHICEFTWVKNCLYTSIDKLRNPTLTATLKKGVLF